MGGATGLTYQVAVRALCEFTAKVGDLDLRFTPSPSAQEGIVGHRTVASRRNTRYQNEVALEGEYRQLKVKGRADGYDPDANRLEEVKTYRGDLDAQPANHRRLHWAQVKVYGWLMCQKLGWRDRPGAGVLRHRQRRRNLLSQRFRPPSWRRSSTANARCSSAGPSRKCSTAPRATVPRKPWRSPCRLPSRPACPRRIGVQGRQHRPLPDGPGAHRHRQNHRHDVPAAQGPCAPATGQGVLSHRQDPGRTLALDASEVLFASGPDLQLRVLELVARDKACEHLDKACHGESCPLAKGFYDRLPAARIAAAQVRLLNQRNLRDVALAHAVCPYYLSQEMARWADLVVADYNYYFDFGAMLFGLAQLNQWRVAVLVDEAHNLVERARSMYSASLDQYSLKTCATAPPSR
jgi:hypothetical protein